MAFRVDASPRIGAGHLARCLTLADALKERGAQIEFLCRPGFDSIHEQVHSHGHAWSAVDAPEASERIPGESPYADWLGCSQPEDALACIPMLQRLQPDWLVVDHYALDWKWQQLVRPSVDRIMVIDDLADRRHSCDLLLDQNYYRNLGDRYKALVPRECIQLLGPTFALLRPEFAAARREANPRGGRVRAVLVTFGGFVEPSLVERTLEAAESLNLPEVKFVFVLGHSLSRWEERGQGHAIAPTIKLLGHVTNMAELMLEADVSIGGGGATTLERCFLGLPTLAVEVAENQREMLNDLADAGCIRLLGSSSALSAAAIAAALIGLVDDPASREALSKRGMSLVADGTSGIASLMERKVHA